MLICGTRMATELYHALNDFRTVETGFENQILFKTGSKTVKSLSQCGQTRCLCGTERPLTLRTFKQIQRRDALQQLVPFRDVYIAVGTHDG